MLSMSLCSSGGEAELLVFDLARVAEASMLVLLLWPPSLCMLEVDREALARRSGETEVLVFDLADVAKALAQFEHSLEVLVFILDASLEAIEQFVQATEVEEAFLGHCLRLRLDCFVFAFNYAGAAALPLNMVDAGLRQMVSSVAGGCYEPSCDTLPQPLTLTACCRTVVIKCPMDVVLHQVEDVYNFNVAFAGLRELLDL